MSPVARAQGVVTLDTRGQMAAAPRGPVLVCDPVAQARQPLVHFTLSVADPSNLAAGQPFEYELLLTNAGLEDLLLPRSLTATAIHAAGKGKAQYQTATVNFEVVGEQDSPSQFGAGLAFYGLTADPSNILRLQSGDSVRIIGNATLPAKAPAGKARLGASYTLTAGGLDASGKPRCSGKDKSIAWTAFTQNSIGIVVQGRK